MLLQIKCAVVEVHSGDSIQSRVKNDYSRRSMSLNILNIEKYFTRSM